MALVERDDVRKLLESPEPDATLVLSEGRSVIVAGSEADASGLVIISRRDLEDQAPATDLTDQRLDELASRLDLAAQDLGA
jgi:hypothetical protein